jgi:hypothetical protein
VDVPALCPLAEACRNTAVIAIDVDLPHRGKRATQLLIRPGFEGDLPALPTGFAKYASPGKLVGGTVHDLVYTCPVFTQVCGRFPIDCLS